MRGIRLSPLLILSIMSALVACGASDGSDIAASSDPAAIVPTVPGKDPASGPQVEGANDGGTQTAEPDAGSASADAGHPDAAKAAGPACKKHLTVIFAVGTGAGAVASHSNGCWTVVDADGAANTTFRKCSTSNFVVQNGSAPNFAFDDTNPNAALSSDQTFLTQCSAGATGDGYEYMSYRGSWRLLGAPQVKAYFAELYSTDQTIDDYYTLWPTTLNGHTVSPMINVGPNDPTTIHSAALKMCNRVADHGYFGVYNGAYKLGMGPTDARALALVSALDKCTL